MGHSQAGHSQAGHSVCTGQGVTVGQGGTAGQDSHVGQGGGSGQPHTAFFSAVHTSINTWPDGQSAAVVHGRQVEQFVNVSWYVPTSQYTQFSVQRSAAGNLIPLEQYDNLDGCPDSPEQGLSYSKWASPL